MSNQGLREHDLGPVAFRATALLFVVALLFGGATRLDVLVPIIPRLVAIALILVLLAGRVRLFAGWSIWERLIWALLLATPLLQLIPMPFDMWTALPGRSYPAQLFTTLGIAPAEPLSMTPDRTLNAFFALLPAFAGYIACRIADSEQQRSLFQITLVAALVSAVLGLAQVTSGAGSALYFYRITNSDSAVGLFSNANHLASFLAAGMLLLAYFVYSRLENRTSRTPIRGPLLVAGIALLVLAGAILLSQSRAGFAFAGVAVIASLMIFRGATGLRRKALAVIVMVLAAGAVAGYIWLASRPGFADNMVRYGSEEGRLQTAPTFWRMIQDLFPFGSGLGSFDPVYRGYEQASRLIYNYLNNAHNDYAQLLIEAGLVAALGLAVFAAWWLRQSWAIMVKPRGNGADIVMRRVAWTITFIFLAHALVDYPLRGAAISLLFAQCCAILATAAQGRGVQSSFAHHGNGE